MSIKHDDRKLMESYLEELSEIADDLDSIPPDKANMALIHSSLIVITDKLGEVIRILLENNENPDVNVKGKDN